MNEATTTLTRAATLALLSRNPLALFAMLLWLMRGKAYLKREIARRVELDPAALPYNASVVDWVPAQHSSRSLVLCTAADTGAATPVADYLGCFSTVLASDGSEPTAARTQRALQPMDQRVERVAVQMIESTEISDEA